MDDPFKSIPAELRLGTTLGPIHPGAAGRITFQGKFWKAETVSEELIQEGITVAVVGRNGDVLLVDRYTVSNEGLVNIYLKNLCNVDMGSFLEFSQRQKHKAKGIPITWETTIRRSLPDNNIYSVFEGRLPETEWLDDYYRLKYWLGHGVSTSYKSELTPIDIQPVTEGIELAEESNAKLSDLDKLSSDINALSTLIQEKQAVTEQIKLDTRQVLSELAEVVDEL